MDYIAYNVSDRLKGAFVSQGVSAFTAGMLPDTRRTERRAGSEVGTIICYNSEI